MKTRKMPKRPVGARYSDIYNTLPKDIRTQHYVISDRDYNASLGLRWERQSKFALAAQGIVLGPNVDLSKHK